MTADPLTAQAETPQQEKQAGTADSYEQLYARCAEYASLLRQCEAKVTTARRDALREAADHFEKNAGTIHWSAVAILLRQRAEDRVR